MNCHLFRESSRRQSELEKDERRKRKIREDLNYLSVHRLDLLKAGAYAPEGIVAKESELNFELTSLQESERISDTTMKEVVKEIIKLSELLKNIYFYYKNATPHEKENIIKGIFSELTINGETLSYQCKKGFQPLINRFVAFYDPTGIRTRVSSLKSSRPRPD